MVKTRRTILVLGLVAALATGGLAVASNMGVMVRFSFATPDEDHWLSLPYRTDLENAQDVCERIGPAVRLVSYFDTDSLARVDWGCPFGQNFTLVPGQALFVRVGAPVETLFIGSHDPAVQLPPNGFNFPNRDYYVSLPYNTTAVVAQDLCREITGVSLISRFDAATHSIQDWTCPFGVNFPIRSGEAYRVRVSQPGPGFVPEHY